MSNFDVDTETKKQWDEIFDKLELTLGLRNFFLSLTNTLSFGNGTWYCQIVLRNTNTHSGSDIYDPASAVAVVHNLNTIPGLIRNSHLSSNYSPNTSSIDSPYYEFLKRVCISVEQLYCIILKDEVFCKLTIKDKTNLIYYIYLVMYILIKCSLCDYRMGDGYAVLPVNEWEKMNSKMDVYVKCIYNLYSFTKTQLIKTNSIINLDTHTWLGFIKEGTDIFIEDEYHGQYRYTRSNIYIPRTKNILKESI